LQADVLKGKGEWFHRVVVRDEKIQEVNILSEAGSIRLTALCISTQVSNTRPFGSMQLIMQTHDPGHRNSIHIGYF
jgi:hypothetical protein